MPTGATLHAMDDAVTRQGLKVWLGAAFFESANWHQSLSDRYFVADYGPDLEARLISAGSRVRAHVATMILNRITMQGPNCAFRAKGTPHGFKNLLAAVRAAVNAEGLPCESGHSPHVTVSYRAPGVCNPVLLQPPIGWEMSEITLVKGRAEDDRYRYDIVERWQLLRGPQLQLFY